MPVVRDDVIFDFGMHKGEDTAYYLAKGFNVVAFEADPDHAAHCRSRFAEAIRTQRLTIVEGAIAPPTESGRITFYKNLGNTFQGTISDEWATRLRRRHKESLAIEVPRIDIAGQFRAFGIPHYLKIDIEGADMLVLEALAAFPDRPPYLSFESEKLEFARLVEELDLLRALGYTKFRAVQQKYIRGTTVETKDRLGNPLGFTFESGASGIFGADIAEWQSYEECRAAYRDIFKTYRWFGEGSLINRMPGGRQLKSILRRTPFVNPLPGWYDTHAALA
jgi:FkbM family methyltransferase